VTWDGITFHIESVEGQRIEKLRVKFQPWHKRDEPQPDDAAEA